MSISRCLCRSVSEIQAQLARFSGPITLEQKGNAASLYGLGRMDYQRRHGRLDISQLHGVIDFKAGAP